MGSLSIWHWLILGGIALVLFGGKGKISDVMGDVAKGVKSFKKGLADDDAPAKPAESARVVDQRSIDAAADKRPVG
ncbi:MAG: twin-arginine translocase TatA/TatE family subunit [Hyphomicrobiales bacterium]|nr:twin-arginine translocase TatA/TatE family subunit [Hyphomicrobiales bacterium]MDE2017116.1 twin-arginine translocase TatA/TatE family subunit [Hyphomicrobiales bacterium]